MNKIYRFVKKIKTLLVMAGSDKKRSTRVHPSTHKCTISEHYYFTYFMLYTINFKERKSLETVDLNKNDKSYLGKKLMEERPPHLSM